MRTRPVAVATTVIVLALAFIGYLHAPRRGTDDGGERRGGVE